MNVKRVDPQQVANERTSLREWLEYHRATLLMKIDGKWLTPPIGDGVLAGVMRALVVEYCGVEVKSIEVADLARVDSAFLLSSLRIAQPVASINGRLLEQSPQFQAEIEAMAVRTSVG